MRLSVSVLLVLMTWLSGPGAQGQRGVQHGYAEMLEELREEVGGLRDKATSLETTMELLKRENTYLQYTLSNIGRDVVTQGDTITDMWMKQRSHETKMDDLEKQNSDRPKVAFSAGLSSNISPEDTSIVVYNNIITNIGQAYDASTGIFEAPERGLYFFRYTASNRMGGNDMDLVMFKNDQRILHNYGTNHRGHYEFMSNGVNLELSKGDRVYMQLHGGDTLTGNRGTFNTFSGFLVFSL